MCEGLNACHHSCVGLPHRCSKVRQGKGEGVGAGRPVGEEGKAGRGQEGTASHAGEGRSQTILNNINPRRDKPEWNVG